MTNAWHDWFRISISQMISGSTVLLETKLRSADFDSFRMPLLCVIYKTESPHQECCAYLDHRHPCQSPGCAKKQTAVSHSSEAEVICLDEGIRLEGLPALQLWEWRVGNSSKIKGPRKLETNIGPGQSAASEKHRSLLSFSSQRNVICDKCRSSENHFRKLVHRRTGPLRIQGSSDQNENKGTKPELETRHSHS